jgi:hypothetical protein
MFLELPITSRVLVNLRGSENSNNQDANVDHFGRFFLFTFLLRAAGVKSSSRRLK